MQPRGCISLLFYRMREDEDMNTIEKLLDLVATTRFVDMTHALDESIPYWPTHKPFSAELGDHQSKGDESYWRTITIGEHSGTHIDALSHFFEGSKNVDDIPLTQIMGRGVNIDVTDTPPCGRVSLHKIKDFEARCGEIREGDIVFFRFGWDEKWTDNVRFLRDWPGTSKEAAEYLLGKKVKAVGCDTLALDAYGGENVSHRVLLGNGINIIENVDKLGELPAFFGVIGLPCKFRGGSGSTLRLMALLDPEAR